ncbi:hypothetical protein GCM10009798_03690 [Nocardioides panacihumi]|uniref:Uncharacterized protein n=1 Tax=Nocardioides panacihumi TaxID=400774 RepID=A0ABN2Q9Q9_9ACTN
MTAKTNAGSRTVAVQLRRILLELARREDECAADERATLPYWLACPPSVQGHRAAADALREQADRLLARTRPTLASGGGRIA